jgi:hypothetical protein
MSETKLQLNQNDPLAYPAGEVFIFGLLVMFHKRETRILACGELTSVAAFQQPIYSVTNARHSQGICIRTDCKHNRERNQ